jgi:hypothetical protein
MEETPTVFRATGTEVVSERATMGLLANANATTRETVETFMT